MNAMIIVFNGEFPTQEEIKNMLDDCSFIVDVPCCKVLNEESLAKLLLESAGIPSAIPSQITPGDDAVITLAGLTEMKSEDEFVLSLFHSLKKHPNNVVEKACKILASDATVNKGVARKYGFTESKRNIIKKFINNV